MPRCGSARVVRSCLLVAVVSHLPAAAQGLTAEEIVARCGQAMGGLERVQAVQTLRVAVVYPDHGAEPLVSEFRRPNQVRTRVTVFDGTQAAIWRKAGKDGEAPGPVLVPEDELKDFEVDVAWFFPAFFDHTPTYLGVRVVGGAETHVLEVTLPLGATMTYFIDAESFLLSSATADVVLHGTAYHSERALSEFRPVSGVLFPHSFTYPGRQGETRNATVTSIEVNVPFGDDHFRVPPEAT